MNAIYSFTSRGDVLEEQRKGEALRNMYRGNLLSARVRPDWAAGSNGFCVAIAWRFCGWAILLLGLLSIYIQQPPFFFFCRELLEMPREQCTVLHGSHSV